MHLPGEFQQGVRVLGRDIFKQSQQGACFLFDKKDGFCLEEEPLHPPLTQRQFSELFENNQREISFLYWLQNRFRGEDSFEEESLFAHYLKQVMSLW